METRRGRGKSEVMKAVGAAKEENHGSAGNKTEGC